MAGTQVYEGSTHVEWDTKNYEEQKFVENF